MSNLIQRERALLKGRWIYLLVLSTCCGVSALVAQQGQTIDQQRSLIQVLWGDSKELTSLKMREFSAQHSQPKLSSPSETTEGNQATAPKPPAAKPRAQKPEPKEKKSPERQAIEKPGPRLLRYI